MLENYRAARRLRQREIAREYLYSQAREHLERYPQLCCYSFDWIGFDVNIDGRYDRDALDLILSRVDVSGRTVLDIGANIGNHTAAFAERAGRVFAFEPHPRTFKLLDLNVGELPNVTTINVGLSDKAGTATAVSPHLNYGATTISERGAGNGESAWTFELATLDSFDIADVALVKIDVEGHELPALRGGEALLKRHRPVVMFEQNEPSGCVEYLRSLGYAHLYSIERTIPWRTPQALPGPVRKLGRIAESLIFGPSDWQASLVPVEAMEPRAYPALVASVEPL